MNIEISVFIKQLLHSIGHHYCQWVTRRCPTPALFLWLSRYETTNQWHVVLNVKYLESIVLLTASCSFFLSASASPAGKWLSHKQKPNSEPWVAISISVHTNKVIYLLLCLCNLILKGNGCLNVSFGKNISLLIGSHICFEWWVCFKTIVSFLWF